MTKVNPTIDWNTPEFKKRTLCTFGIANIFKDGKRDTPKTPEFGLQYYDFDGIFTPGEFDKILDIFPNDLFTYKSKHGYHFISLTLMDIDLAIRNANTLSRKFKTQDYILPIKDCRYLVLRVAPKWNKESKLEISKNPEFLQVVKYPKKKTIISGNHLDFYWRYMNLPQSLYDFYLENCRVRKGIIYFIYYTTGD